MAVFVEGLNMTFVKLIIVGERGVGKTSLIRTMKEGVFRESWDEADGLVRKVLYWPDEKISLQLGELYLDQLNDIPDWAQNAQGCLLLYDSEDTASQQQIKDKWYSLVNRHFRHVPLFLIRTKADQTDFQIDLKGNKLRQEVHAVGFFESSAKRGRGIEETFVEIVKYHQKLKKKQDNQAANDPLNAKTSWAAIGSLITNSGPLIRQTFANIRECITNPLAFAEQKRAIQCCFPLLNFGVKTKKEEEETLCAKDLAEKDSKSSKRSKDDSK